MFRRSSQGHEHHRGPDNTIDYGQPFGWWGSGWISSNGHSLLWLIERGALDVLTAAFLSIAVELRASFYVVAEPHEAGKTTMLTALADFLPDDCEPIFLRGWYERFTFLQSASPDQAFLLCNEISAHLPIYLWGDGVRKVFDAVATGYPLATTMHARSATDALEQLISVPLNVPVEQVALIDLVVSIEVGYVGNRLLRRVVRIERIMPGRESVRIVELALRESLHDEISYQSGRYVAVLAELGGCSNLEASSLLAQRTSQIDGWLARGLAAAPSIRAELVATRR